MSQQLYSVEQVAERLGLHVRTVRNYVREGRLKAVRIGKQYRIAHEDLEALTGGAVPPSPRTDAPRTRHVDVSTIVEIDAVPPDTASRICNGLSAVTVGRRGDGPKLRVDARYDETRARLKLIVSGDLAASAGLLQLVQLYLDQ